MPANTQQRVALVGIFDDRSAAEEAVTELESIGFNAEQIGFAIRGSDVSRGGVITDAVGVKDRSGAVTGAFAGGLTGGILAAAVTALLPGVGPVLSAGMLAMFAGYAGAGAAIGGILGAMMGLGYSEDEARRYEQLSKEGKAIVTVRAGTRSAEAGQVLQRHGGYDLHNQSASDEPQAGEGTGMMMS
jgi:hypothetical protein